MPASSIKRAPITATAEEQRALEQIQRFLDNENFDGVVLRGPNEEVYKLPESLALILHQATRHLVNNEAVSVLPVDRELTTQPAADLLNVSRPYLIQLLEMGEIPYRPVGTHRRVEFEHVMEYKQRRDQKRQDGLRDIPRLSQEMGLHDEPEANP